MRFDSIDSTGLDTTHAPLLVCAATGLLSLQPLDGVVVGIGVNVGVGVGGVRVAAAA